jgi:hypothetical protein
LIVYFYKIWTRINREYYKNQKIKTVTQFKMVAKLVLFFK